MFVATPDVFFLIWMDMGKAGGRWEDLHLSLPFYDN